MAGTEDVDTLIGKRAQELRGLLKIKYPMEHGIVTDWEDMERIWQYVYSDELRTLPEEVRRPSDHLVDFSHVFIAPCPSYRSTSQSTPKPRNGSANLL